jgi:hypothetical protein
MLFVFFIELATAELLLLAKTCFLLSVSIVTDVSLL